MCAIVIAMTTPHRAYRISKDALWSVMANVRDFYEDEHPITHEILALGEMYNADDLERLRAHRRLCTRIETGGHSATGWPPRLHLFDDGRAWVAQPVEDGDLFERGRIERAWNIDPLRMHDPAPAPAAQRAGLRLDRWLEQQWREMRFLIYPLLDLPRLAAEAQEMLALSAAGPADRAA